VGGCVGIIVTMLLVGNDDASKVGRVLGIVDVEGKRVGGIVMILNVGWIVGITLGAGVVGDGMGTFVREAFVRGAFVRGDEDDTFVGRYVGGIEVIVGYCVGRKIGLMVPVCGRIG
jgi:hypothetical protein